MIILDMTFEQVAAVAGVSAVIAAAPFVSLFMARQMEISRIDRKLKTPVRSETMEEMMAREKMLLPCPSPFKPY